MRRCWWVSYFLLKKLLKYNEINQYKLLLKVCIIQDFFDFNGSFQSCSFYKTIQSRLPGKEMELKTTTKFETVEAKFIMLSDLCIFSIRKLLKLSRYVVTSVSLRLTKSSCQDDHCIFWHPARNPDITESSVPLTSVFSYVNLMSSLRAAESTKQKTF